MLELDADGTTVWTRTALPSSVSPSASRRESVSPSSLPPSDAVVFFSMAGKVGGSGLADAISGGGCADGDGAFGFRKIRGGLGKARHYRN